MFPYRTFLIILTVYTVTGLVTENGFYKLFTDIENASLTKISIDEASGDLFVGGTNMLYHLNSTLDTIHSIKLGPVNDSQECRPKDNICIVSSSNISTETDDIVKVLVYNSRVRRLIVCGSAHQGMCFLYDPGTQLRESFKSNGKETYIGGKNTTVVIQSLKRPTDYYNDEDQYFVAQSYDGRNINYFHKEFSKLSFTNRTDGFRLSEYAHYSNLEVCSDRKSTYHNRFIYGFESGNYAYTIFVRSTEKNGRTTYETKLAQICRDDMSYKSYVEFPFKCTGSGEKRYNVASAAFFYRIGDVTQDNGVLYVTFGISTFRTGHLEDSYEGSAICAFSMKSIKLAVLGVLRDCFASNKGTEPDWKCNHTQCHNDGLQSLENYCGPNFNFKGIQAWTDSTALETRSKFTLTKELMTSVAFATQRNQANQTDSIVILGTSSGALLKILIENGTQYARYQLSDSSIQPDPVFDKNHSHVFLLSGEKMFKIPMYSCRIHTTCGQCVTTPDPLGCGWCYDHCSTKQSCNGVWHENTCPPFIQSIIPTSGPVSGNTLLTIKGEYFGFTKAFREVHLEGYASDNLECSIQTAEENSIICRTPNVSNISSYLVTVNVSDTSGLAHGNVNVLGYSERFLLNFTYLNPSNLFKTMKEMYFVVHYYYHWVDTTTAGQITSVTITSLVNLLLKPEVFSISPMFGPKMGGTTVTVTGRNLDIGSSLAIEVANFNCVLESKTFDTVTCYTSKWLKVFSSNTLPPKSTGIQSKCIGSGPIKVIIDGGDVDMATDAAFCYMENPEISNIFPLKTIESGGMVLTVEGKNFDSLTKHALLVNFGEDGITDEIVKCTEMSGGTIIHCTLPEFNGSIPDDQTVTAELVIQSEEIIISDRYQGNTSLTYFPDPVFYKVSDNITINAADDAYLLELKGEKLDLALRKKDIIINIEESRCDVVELEYSYAKCKIDKNLVKNSQIYNYIRVKAGNIEITIGKIIFVHRQRSSFALTATKNAGIAGGIAVCILFSLVVFIIIIVKKCRPFRRKSVHIDQNSGMYANERSISSVVPPSSLFDEREDSQQRQRVHDSRYVKYGDSGDARQPLLTEGATGGGESKASALSTIDHSTVVLLEKQNLLIDRNYLVLGENLGHGEFGCVYKGYLSRPGQKGQTQVAVKTILRSGYGSNVEEFLNEALMMKDFNHPNVLRLIGISLEEGEFPLVIIPFMALGDLLTYIRNEENNPTVKDLVTFGIDIAQGMEYLSGIKYVHRDLAARNCMLNEQKTVKVADFGLSRDIYSKEYYSCDNKRKLPVKWMAPESLEKGTYTTKSDVWSYGIVIWELLTRGASPYPGVENWDIAMFIKMGRRLPRPEYCPEALYATMLKCWEYNPGLRPTFKELLEEIMDIVLNKSQESTVRDIPVDLDKCTNYDYGDQHIPEWATELRVNMEENEQKTNLKQKLGTQVSWTSENPDSVDMAHSISKSSIDTNNSDSNVSRQRFDSAKFSNKDNTLQFGDSSSVHTPNDSLNYANSNLHNINLQGMVESSEESCMLSRRQESDDSMFGKDGYVSATLTDKDINLHQENEKDFDLNKNEVSTHTDKTSTPPYWNVQAYSNKEIKNPEVVTSNTRDIDTPD